MNPKYLIIYIFIIVALGCQKSEDEQMEATFDPTPYTLDISYFPPPKLPEDNPLTIKGVALGKKLFYDKTLSKDGTQSCASCHVQKDGFSDMNQFSVGVEGLIGRRQAMPIFNMAWHPEAFFWDGRAPSLRHQAVMPIEDPLEMNASLPEVISRLSESKEYKDAFIEAFGSPDITTLTLGLAMEQFMLSITSHDSKFDQFLDGQVQLTPAEMRGMKLFNTEFDPSGKEKGAECFHCHAGFNFVNNKFMNNGLDKESQWMDLGLFELTRNINDRAKFKTPSLRNIAVTAPYMHDGRFATLREVIEHYNTGVEESATVDPLMQYNIDPGLGLSDDDIDDLIAFLHTLTDSTFLNNPEYSDPN